MGLYTSNHKCRSLLHAGKYCKTVRLKVCQKVINYCPLVNDHVFHAIYVMWWSSTSEAPTDHIAGECWLYIMIFPWYPKSHDAETWKIRFWQKLELTTKPTTSCCRNPCMWWMTLAGLAPWPLIFQAVDAWKISEDKGWRFQNMEFQPWTMSWNI